MSRAFYELADTTLNTIQFSDTTYNGRVMAGDTLATDDADKVVIEAPIDYQAKDSIIFSLDGQRVYMYGESIVKYQRMCSYGSFL